MKRTADVVIIGGGCMGASVAYHLTRRGISEVVIVEREQMLGMGSTGRNAGGVRHQFSTEANVRLSIESIRLFENFEDEVGYPIDFHQDGYLFLLSSEASLAAFTGSVEVQRRLGVDVDLLEPEAARRLAPGLNVDGVLGATYCARDGIADPNGVTMGFAKAAQSRGVTVLRGVEATGITTIGGRVAAVQTTAGEITTAAVINAAGPHAQRVGEMIGLAVPVLPYRRHIFITEPIGQSTHDPMKLEVPGSRIMVIDFETTFYFHREGGGILFGMSDKHEPSSFDTTVNWEFLEEVTRVAVTRLPRLARSSVAHAWAGLYEITPDAMPIIGGSPIEGFFMITGFSGHGFQHCPAAGRVLADLIVDGSVAGEDLAPFSFDRFSAAASMPETNVV
jgi:heterotetrameric sarcosine oxidase beta subunit